ncbi:Glycogen synthase 1 [Ensifer adhaerens]|uniref:glycogen synthase GlgA n=1 Tax=Ensifer adhaerens TaxID=106592 RepID=UPI00156A0B29|nr:glycogen synthase GlgA [Ensifer adhaerens]NRP21859.1 Glycogen synthase 1 [Ensifer adhaerens]
MNILAVTAEIFPLVKTGGLADVAGSLPKALAAFGVRVRTLVPGYPTILRALPEASVVRKYDDLFGERAKLLSAQFDGLELLILDAPAFFDRTGGPYLDVHGKDYADNWKRFAALSAVGSDIGENGVAGWRPCIVHAHDWHSALSLVYLKYGRQPDIPRVLTVHNLAFQGQFPACHFARLGLPDEAYAEVLEYYGELGYLKAGVMSAHTITVVSPTYAREVMSPEGGMGLDGVMNARHDDVVGIVNGIDLDVWDPSRDPHINYPFSSRTPLKRLGNRKDLLDHFDLADRNGPVFASVNRLTWQKGMDLLADVVDEFATRGGMLVVHGQGDPAIERKFINAAQRYPDHVSVRIGYDERLAHLIHAGSDAMLVPSRFEPCGLTQLYAMRYGCVPIVARTGGLSETIIDANDAAVHAQAATGIQFLPIDHAGLRHALRRAFKLYRRHRSWDRLRRQAMKADSSWERSASQYCQLYSRLLSKEEEFRRTA